MTNHVDPRSFEAFDTLTAEQRGEVLEHARVCGACRSSLVERDPSSIFAVLAVQPIPEDALDRLSERVAADIAVADAPAAPRRWTAFASIAAALLLAAFLGVQIDRSQPVTRLASAPPPPVAVASLEQDSEPLLPARGVELLSSPGEADVVDFALGETQVVMIFDRELDI